MPIQSLSISPKTLVKCEEERHCRGNYTASTYKDCCDHDTEPYGVSFVLPGLSGCHSCPVGKRKKSIILLYSVQEANTVCLPFDKLLYTYIKDTVIFRYLIQCI